MTEILWNIKNNKKIIQEKTLQNPEPSTKWTLKREYDHEYNIISDDVKYICYTKYIWCDKVIDKRKIYFNLQNININDYNGIWMINVVIKIKRLNLQIL